MKGHLTWSEKTEESLLEGSGVLVDPSAKREEPCKLGHTYTSSNYAIISITYITDI